MAGTARFGSSFHGRVSELRGAAVDEFSWAARAYFLSHCHSDHTQGLYTPQLVNVLLASSDIRIYMSRHSARIVRHSVGQDSKLKIIAARIVELDLETIHITLPKTEIYTEEYVSVTAIPAGHCLGSIMFLFQTARDENVLFTGDFRISENDIHKFAQLHDKNNEPIVIHKLYVDTTFIDPKYMYFPKRSDSLNELKRHIGDFLTADEENEIALSTSAKYGYEFVFIEVAKQFNMKIFVKRDMYTLYSEIPKISDAITNDSKATRIHACSHTSEKNHNFCYQNDKCVNDEKVLFIRFSAMSFKQYQPETTSIIQVYERRINVCFPTHCSSSEIHAFVSYYTPKVTFGFPNPYNPENRRREDIDGKLLMLTTPTKMPTTPVKSPCKKTTTPRMSPKRLKLSPGKEDIKVLKRLFSFEI